MRLGVLFSGGKDSCLALHKAHEKEDVVCLISLVSENPESYMFHTPNIHLTQFQAHAMGLPQVMMETKGRKEEELSDLRRAIEEAQTSHDVEGIVSGAIESVYQAERIQRICHDHDLFCFNPLWKKNQEQLLREIVGMGMKVIISGISALPLDKSFLGREVEDQTIDELKRIREKYGISLSGEGGEIETTVLDAPLFKKRIEILDSEREYERNSGTFLIREVKLVEK